MSDSWHTDWVILMERYFPYEYDLVMYIARGRFKIENKVRDPNYDCHIPWKLLFGEIASPRGIEILEDIRKVGKQCVKIVKIQSRLNVMAKSE
jgi:hypothetical protein